MPINDWVMVCSSMFRARPVPHSTKRFSPWRLKPRAKDSKMPCQTDHSQVAFISHLLKTSAGLASVRVLPGGALVKGPSFQEKLVASDCEVSDPTRSPR